MKHLDPICKLSSKNQIPTGLLPEVDYVMISSGKEWIWVSDRDHWTFINMVEEARGRIWNEFFGEDKE
jgi:hypothetical protein